MAILHRAWTFDAAALSRRVTSIVRVGGAQALRDAARQIVAAGHDGTAAALAELRFDPEWIAEPDDTSSRTVESVVIILASHLERAPSIAGHVSLRRALFDLGWTVAGLDLLYRGRPLETLFDVSRDPELARCIAGINQYGGWIPRADAASLRRRFDELMEPVPVKDGLDEARAMLHVASLRAADLFVVLD
ncbi:MAG TPA: hypothetical protein VGG20_09260 [Thermoanaerobaculia bacterium]|jgi:hypothetical protein